MDNPMNHNQISEGGIRQKQPSPVKKNPSPPSPEAKGWRETGYAEMEESEFLDLRYWHVSDERRKAGIPRGQIVLLPDEVEELCRRAKTGRDAAREYALEHRHAPRAKLGKTTQPIDTHTLTASPDGAFPATNSPRSVARRTGNRDC